MYLSHAAVGAAPMPLDQNIKNDKKGKHLSKDQGVKVKKDKNEER